MILSFSKVKENMQHRSPDLSDDESAMMAASLIVIREWELAGKLPASHLDMWPDVQLLLVQNGYKIAAP